MPIPTDPDVLLVEVSAPAVETEASILVQIEPAPAGPKGEPAAFVFLTLVEYLALPPETQLDGRWYVILKPA